MRALFLITILATVAWLGSSTPVDHDVWLFNSPAEELIEEEEKRVARSAPGKEHEDPINGDRPSTLRPTRKGEYVCGNKICRMKPGVEPRGCNGRCQYPLI